MIRHTLALIAAIAVTLVAAPPAAAQTPEPKFNPVGTPTENNPAPVKLRCWDGATAKFVACSLSGGGGGAGDASASNQASQITAANLTNTRLGDVTSPAAGSVNSRLEAMRALLAGTLTIGLPSGASTAALQTSGNASLTAISGQLPAARGATTGSGSPSVVAATDAIFVADTVIRATPANRGASVGTSAVQLMASNTARRGFAIQNQSATASCYFSGIGTATADFNALLLPPGAYFETPNTHVNTGAISIICTGAATPVYAREW